jgi:hypothetical protein
LRKKSKKESMKKIGAVLSVIVVFFVAYRGYSVNKNIETSGCQERSPSRPVEAASTEVAPKENLQKKDTCTVQEAGQKETADTGPKQESEISDNKEPVAVEESDIADSNEPEFEDEFDIADNNELEFEFGDEGDISDNDEQEFGEDEFFDDDNWKGRGIAVSAV